jgi:Flp pilus assembly protein TadD
MWKWLRKREDDPECQDAEFSNLGNLFSDVPITRESWLQRAKEREASRFHGQPSNVDVPMIAGYPMTAKDSPTFVPTDKEPVCLLRIGSGWEETFFHMLSQGVHHADVSLDVKTHCYPSYPVLQLVLCINLQGRPKPWWGETLGDICDGDIRGFVSELSRLGRWKIVVGRHDPLLEKQRGGMIDAVSATVTASPERLAAYVREVRTATEHYLGIPKAKRSFEIAADQFVKDDLPIDGITETSTLADTEDTSSSMDADGHYERGLGLGKSGQIEEAERHVLDAIRLNPSHAEALLWLGVYLSDRAAGLLDSTRQQPGDRDRAEGYLRRAIESRPSLAQAHHYLGRTLRERGQVADAKREFTEAIRLAPDHAGAHLSLGTILLWEERDTDGAERQLREATRLSPRYAEAHACLARLLYDKDSKDDAEREARLAAEINPNLSVAHSVLGFVSLSRGRLPEAESAFRRAVQTEPHSASAHMNLGMVLDRARDSEAAAQEYGKVLEISPGNVDARFYLGALLDKMGDTEGAESMLATAIHLNPRHAPTQFCLGCIREGKGDLVAAEAHMRKAVDLEPKTDLYRRGLERVVTRKTRS